MEALLPPHVLHGDDDCNQLVAPFNTESETSHTARGSSDSRTGYDGGPLDRAISGPAWTPSSSQETWAPQPDSNCDSRVSSAVQHPLAVTQPQRNDGLRAWLRDKAGVAVRFLDDVVEVLTAEQVDGPEDLAFFATTPAFDAKLAATTAARIRAVLKSSDMRSPFTVRCQPTFGDGAL